MAFADTAAAPTNTVMAILTVIAYDADSPAAVKQRIKEQYPDHYQVPGANVWFVRSDDTTSKVAENLGMNDTDQHTGIVVKKDAWYGYADVGLWEWGGRNE